MSNANWQTQLTVLEKNTFLDYFKQVDADNKGIVLQDEAMDFLKKSDIPQNILVQFWNATDNDRKGFLTEEEFCTILKLIACAQNGIMTSDPILTTKAPLPDFSGNGSANNHQMSSTPQKQYQSLPPQTSNKADVVSPEDRMKYMNLFQTLGPENNLLTGERARAAFFRSNLPPAILQNIWNLADTRKSGSLNQTEFIIAMFYIERAMKGMTNLPTSLPANVYASATGRSVPPSPLMRNNTLQVHSPPPVPMRSPVFKGATRATVDIAPEEYVKYKTFFHQLDTDRSGYVSGPDAVVFFRHSKLPESDLARIWDLADTNSTGQLNEQEFAMAMHMINRRVAGGEISNSLPAFSSFVEQQHQPAVPQQQHQNQNVDLLGINSDFTGIPSSTSTVAPPQPQSNDNNNTDFLQRTYSTLQSNTSSEFTRAKNAQSQFNNESQAIQELRRQIEKQKEALAKMKHEADEAERQLDAERKRKEELTKELQMHKQEAKHFSTRIEDAQAETAKLREENVALEKEKQKSPLPSTANLDQAHDFFSLSSAPSTNSNGLFAKVTEPMTSSPMATQNTAPSAISSPSQSNTFDPFAGFKASQQQQQQQSSPVVSINKLKEETELKRSVTPNVDISDIESKFPDLNTMEKNFSTPTSPPPPPPPAAATVSSPVTAAASTSTASPKANDVYNNIFSTANPSLQRSATSAVKTDHNNDSSLARSFTSAVKKDPKSKYGFDLSAFETSSSTSTHFDQPSSSMKDELSSLFGSPIASKIPLSKSTVGTNAFDDVFGNSPTTNTTTTTNKSNSFEDIFSQK